MTESFCLTCCLGRQLRQRAFNLSYAVGQLLLVGLQLSLLQRRGPFGPSTELRPSEESSPWWGAEPGNER